MVKDNRELLIRETLAYVGDDVWGYFCVVWILSMPVVWILPQATKEVKKTGNVLTDDVFDR